MKTLEEICRRADYSTVAMEEAADAWIIARLPKPTFTKLPTVEQLIKYGRAVGANRVLYGSISWHTRSIWVNAGPKTISTATVTAYVLNVQTGRVIYKRTAMQGRSDERSSGLKIAAAILFTPLVTAVSGGPATPQEQRAVQIALAKAYAGWASSAKRASRK